MGITIQEEQLFSHTSSDIPLVTYLLQNILVSNTEEGPFGLTHPELWHGTAYCTGTTLAPYLCITPPCTLHCQSHHESIHCITSQFCCTIFFECLSWCLKNATDIVVDTGYNRLPEQNTTSSLTTSFSLKYTSWFPTSQAKHFNRLTGSLSAICLYFLFDMITEQAMQGNKVKISETVPQASSSTNCKNSSLKSYSRRTELQKEREHFFISLSWNHTMCFGMKLNQVLENYLVFPTALSVLPLTTKIFTSLKWCLLLFLIYHCPQSTQLHENTGFCSKIWRDASLFLWAPEKTLKTNSTS